MAALLILGGFLVIVLGLLWLIVLAFKVSLLWGVASLFPPVLLVFVLRCWTVARKAVIFTTLGFVPLTAGFTQLANEDSAKIEALLSLSWLQATDTLQTPMDIHLKGELHGQAFEPYYGELIDGVLVLREGRDFFAKRELRIALPRALYEQNLEALRLDVLPQDTGNLPEIEIMWLQADQALPEARRISRGYTLHLDLLRQPPNQLQGNFHLVLPPHFKTSMSGDVQLLTDRLQYINGEVDRQHDAMDTLEYVVKDYFQRRFAVDDVIVEPFEVPMPLTSPIDISATVYVFGQPRTNAVRFIKTPQVGWAVAGDQYPKYTAPPPRDVTVSTEDSAKNADLSDTPSDDRRLGFTLQRLLDSPAEYQRLEVHVQTTQGNQVTGRFVGLNAQGALNIEREVKAPGIVSFTVLPNEISQITLLER